MQYFCRSALQDILAPSNPTKVDERDRLLAHTLLDGIILTYSWADVEPVEGQRDFSQVVAAVNLLAGAGKKAIPNLMLYNQTPNDSATPAWVLAKTGIDKVTFSAGGTGNGSTMTVPAAWKPGLYNAQLTPLIDACAAALSPVLQHVAAVKLGIGHIGHLTVQPSKIAPLEAPTQFLAAGWTVNAWRNHCTRMATLHQTEFPGARTLAIGGGILLRDPTNQNYRADADADLNTLAAANVDVIRLNVTPDDPTEAQATFTRLSAAIAAASAGSIQLGFGDDNPLYVPPGPRRTQPQTFGRDEVWFQAWLQLVTSGLPTSMMTFQDVEMMASSPGHATYNQAVVDALTAAKV